MSEEPAEKPKLIIDDDWKERVQSEKEAAAAAAKGKPASDQSAPDHPASETPAAETPAAEIPAAETPASDPPAGDMPDDRASDAGPADQPQQHELPPASFATLVHSLTAQALASLGQIPDAEGKTNIEIGLGKHFIDTLAVLEEKTKGNLDEEEAAALAKMIYELRMLFVHVRQEQSSGATATEPPAEP